jgi:hypothetical protein
MQCPHPGSPPEPYNATTSVPLPDPYSRALLDLSCADLSVVVPSPTLVPLFNVLLTQAQVHFDSQPRTPPLPQQPSRIRPPPQARLTFLIGPPHFPYLMPLGRRPSTTQPDLPTSFPYLATPPPFESCLEGGGVNRQSNLKLTYFK